MSTQPTVQNAVASLTKSFREAHLSSPELDARLLVLNACGLSPEAYILEPARPLAPNENERIEGARSRRLAREPVSRILGYREFWGRRFAITPAVLDPRPDTETLVEAALEIAQSWSQPRQLRILDLGTGSGSILLTLLAELPLAFGVGVDRDPAALETARQNAAKLGLLGRVALVCSDWADAVNGSFDLVVSNPPYIAHDEIASLEFEVRGHDPHLALDGGADGYEAYRHIARESWRILAPDGWVLLEAGAGQANGIIDLFTWAGWQNAARDAQIRRDLSGIERVVAIKRQAA